MLAPFYLPQPEIIFVLLASKFSFTSRRQFWLPCDFIALPYIVSIDFVVHLNLASVLLLKSFPDVAIATFLSMTQFKGVLLRSFIQKFLNITTTYACKVCRKKFLQDNNFTLSYGLTWAPCFNLREFWLANAWFIQAVQLFQINDWHHFLTVFIG